MELLLTGHEIVKIARKLTEITIRLPRESMALKKKILVKIGARVRLSY
jgi:hypothetical protein